MKIFYICYENVGNLDAPATHLREVAENLSSLGHKVRIFAPLMRRFRFPVRVDVTYVPLLPVGKFREASYYVFLWFALFYYALKKGVDIVYVRGMSLNLVPYVFSRLFRKKMLIEINALRVEERQAATRPGWRTFFRRLLEKFNLAFCDKVVTVSADLKLELAQRYDYLNGKLTVVENGANPHIFTPMERRPARRELKIDENGYYLCLISRICSAYSLAQILKIFCHLLTFAPATRLILIGDAIAAQKKNILEMSTRLNLTDQIMLFSQMIQTDLPGYINASDACFLLSQTHNKTGGGISLRMLEYMSCGRPVIAVKGEGAGRFVEELNCGVVIDIDHPKTAATHIYALLSNETLKERLGNLGRNAILNQYTWQHTAQKLTHIYSGLMS